ncbi:MAG: hypothetical protein HFG82_07990 [Dorea sp.]|jgi:lipopolysaccharide biosynthesis protein|nr:hypothetical protein [Dorea sp.]
MEEYYILPDARYRENNLGSIHKRITVIMYFYYFETIEKYIKYINNIPPFFRIEIYSSKSEVLEKLKIYLALNHNIGFHLKNNRGRDISTLLIEAREAMLRSDYICFIHDKSSNAEYLKEETECWIENLWENMLSNQLYMNHILSVFEREKDLGILFPPNPIGEYLFHWYGDTWLSNYYNTCELAKKLKLSIEIKKENMPVGMGTVFWVRGKTLRKLYSLEWTYDMFPEEPLAVDGTLNHAVERILEYVVQDSGYRSAGVMTAEYAAWLLSKAQDYTRSMFSQLQKREHVFNMHQIKTLDRREARLIQYTNLHKQNYIYGAGNYGKALYEFLKDRSISIDGFLVSKLENTQHNFCGRPIKKIDTLLPERGIGIVVGVSYETKNNIEKVLKKYGFKDFIYGF